MKPSISFDWSQGRAFVQDGTIFYSPNCSRTVLIPVEASSNSPFQRERLDASLFKQPVWWSDVYGWQSFIPLAPSYTSTPFEPFCWMPRIVEVDVLVDPKSGSGRRERRFEMHSEDCYTWTQREQLLTEAAERIRIWFKIPGNLPPPPSMFNYKRAHKSRAVAKKMITLARDWFAVWMGFVSYLIASTKRFTPSSSPSYSRPDPNSPSPVWYHRLQEKHSYPAAWLDGLITSTVCSYDAKTPRAGVVFQWSKADRTRPPMEWLVEHNIPMWFVWSREEEQAFSRDRSFAFLQPPNHLIQDALTLLFDSPTASIPLAGLIIQRYYDMGSNPMTNETVRLLKYKEAPSFVLDYTTKIYLGQEASLARVDSRTDAALSTVLQAKRAQHQAISQAEVAFPTQTMLENVEVKGRLFNHWQEFLSKREQRQKEIINVETPKDRQKRLSRALKPGVKNADIYTWEKIQSSGGKEVYMRLRVSKARNESVFASYRSHQRIYNSLANEWDLCREFGDDPVENGRNTKRRSTSSDSDDSEDDEGFDWLRTQYQDTTSFEPGPSTPPRQSSPPHQSYTPPRRPHTPPRRPHTPPHQPYTPPHQPYTPPRQPYTPPRQPYTPPRQPYTPPHQSYVTHQPCTQSRHAPVEHHAMTPPTQPLDNMDVEEDAADTPPFRHYSQNVVETLSFGYGYVASIPGSATQPLATKDWETILVTLGFISPLADLDVEAHERRAISDFFNAMVKNVPLPVASDDLNSNGLAPLSHLFDFALIRRPSSNLYVFSGPRSMASDWLLGVHSADIALYICRYILSNPGAHTVVTVGSRLLERGIPFRTLLALKSSLRQATVINPYNPLSFRLSSHVFTVQDFEAYMLRCQAILSQPQGRAALLRGGIIWRIAKQFLSGDGVLSGPSVEVTHHHVGYMHPSGTPDIQYWDDELTEDEIALICGTYSLYTAQGHISVKSWFPPPVCWTNARTAAQFIEWTARNEKFFGDLVNDIRGGKVTPLTVVEWTSRLRGFKSARILRDNNRSRAKTFMDELIPVATQPAV